MDGTPALLVDRRTVCTGVELLVGDSRDSLPTLAAQSVQCVVTSPPYWGLRDYGLAAVAWDAVEYSPMAGLPPVTVAPMSCALGMEAEPLAFVGHLVAVFRQVRRVLRDDGTCWVNLGPTYSTKPNGSIGATSLQGSVKPHAETRRARALRSNGSAVRAGFAHKNIVGIPWMFALAMQADGWVLRSEVIWAKRNPMPESVHDRPTAAHEQLFLFAKRPKYFFDTTAIAERLEYPEASTADDMARAFSRRRATLADPHQPPVDVRRYRSGNRTPKTGDDTGRPGSHRRSSVPWEDTSGTRNARSVWSIATQPYGGAHFATFPEQLAERCILAGTSAVGGCGSCGAPWRRITEAGARLTSGGGSRKHVAVRRQQGASGTLVTGAWHEHITTGWAPSCRCDAPRPVPCVVLDPFAGTGTVGAVTRRLGRDAVLCEASISYADLIVRRVLGAPAHQFSLTPGGSL